MRGLTTVKKYTCTNTDMDPIQDNATDPILEKREAASLDLEQAKQENTQLTRNESSTTLDGHNPLSSSSEDSKESQQDVQPAPDGGYGWFIVLASFLTHFIVLGTQYSFGVYQEYYLSQEFAGQVNAFSLSFVGSLSSAALLLCGMFSGRIADRIGYRTTMTIGTALLALGYILASFATKVMSFLGGGGDF